MTMQTVVQIQNLPILDLNMAEGEGQKKVCLKFLKYPETEKNVQTRDGGISDLPKLSEISHPKPVSESFLA